MWLHFHGGAPPVIPTAPRDVALGAWVQSMLGTDLSQDAWEGLGDTTEPRLAGKERWLQCVGAARLLRVLDSPLELSDDYLARKHICWWGLR